MLLKSLLAFCFELFNPCVGGNATFGVYFLEESNFTCSFHVILNDIGSAHLCKITSDTQIEIVIC